jgi:hypothetical protein
VTPDGWDLGSVIMRASDTIRAAVVATLDHAFAQGWVVEQPGSGQ